jgi:hypothetical protein
VLKIVGPYGENGWEDPETGDRFYNSTTMTPFGPLGNIKVHRDGDDMVIDQAPEYALIGRGFIDAEGYTDAFGTTWVDIIARNGHVRYQILPDDVVYEDEPAKILTTRLALLAFSEWTPEAEFVEEPRTDVVEVPVTPENLNA